VTNIFGGPFLFSLSVFFHWSAYPCISANVFSMHWVFFGGNSTSQSPRLLVAHSFSVWVFFSCNSTFWWPISLVAHFFLVHLFFALVQVVLYQF
jgi:hypothetical protein